MSRLIWSPEALLDVQRLYRFLATKNADIARRAVRSIRETVAIIAAHPAVGRPIDEMEPEFREWLIDCGDIGYVALFHYDGHTAVVLAVRHQREAGY